ncbi:hypothetical protein [Alicyclobacillus sp. SO9]|uniref:hypothetical protein n=1 Tax=Alicyclobacillus sp. SO9 TaxID=2665646 RepID=UPI0018E76BF9|nr:hypothetical protein [Alicyclobacillus sp. SO9]QQE78381.1 hypothetical protein GI364_21300 [Alicyclobacillus sp. SO9]
MIWRVVNAFTENQSINFDGILAGSHNTRSALEALLAHTSKSYSSYLGRIELGSTAMMKAETDIVISDIPNVDATMMLRLFLISR